MANLGYIQVTRLCNQTCIFCSNPPNRNSLSLEEGLREIDILRSSGYDGVILTGGEPTLSAHLPEWIRYCRSNGFASRIITNGQMLADSDYLASLTGAGLTHVHLSLYSARAEVQAKLSRNDRSLEHALRALENLGAIPGVAVDINTVINRYNADHLAETVAVVLDRFPFVRHFVWNNLDPRMNRASEHPDTIPRLADFEVQLKEAVTLLEAAGRSYRVERVPLCYMPGFEFASTETRKIVKAEERTVFFLDEKGAFRQKTFEHVKADCCRICRLAPICGGLYAMDEYYSSAELCPVFADPEPIRGRILNGRPHTHVRV